MRSSPARTSWCERMRANVGHLEAWNSSKAGGPVGNGVSRDGRLCGLRPCFISWVGFAPFDRRITRAARVWMVAACSWAFAGGKLVLFAIAFDIVVRFRPACHSARAPARTPCPARCRKAVGHHQDRLAVTQEPRATTSGLVQSPQIRACGPHSHTSPSRHRNQRMGGTFVRMSSTGPAEASISFGRNRSAARSKSLIFRSATPARADQSPIPSSVAAIVISRYA